MTPLTAHTRFIDRYWWSETRNQKCQPLLHSEAASGESSSGVSTGLCGHGQPGQQQISGAESCDPLLLVLLWPGVSLNNLTPGLYILEHSPNLSWKSVFHLFTDRKWGVKMPKYWRKKERNASAWCEEKNAD